MMAGVPTSSNQIESSELLCGQHLSHCYMNQMFISWFERIQSNMPTCNVLQWEDRKVILLPEAATALTTAWASALV